MINYEVMFIINPTLEDDKKEATVERVKEVIAADGEVGKVDVWGMRKLAYPIEDLTEGYYVLVNFTSNPEFPAEFNRIANISDDILRAIVIRK